LRQRREERAVGTISGSSTRVAETPTEEIWTTVEDVLGAPQRPGEPKQRVEAA
jgi:hypothetical protein